MKAVETAVKSAFTRAFNQQHLKPKTGARGWGRAGGMAGCVGVWVGREFCGRSIVLLHQGASLHVQVPRWARVPTRLQLLARCLCCPLQGLGWTTRCRRSAARARGGRRRRRTRTRSQTSWGATWVRAALLGSGPGPLDSCCAHVRWEHTALGPAAASRMGMAQLWGDSNHFGWCMPCGVGAGLLALQTAAPVAARLQLSSRRGLGGSLPPSPASRGRGMRMRRRS